MQALYWLTPWEPSLTVAMVTVVSAVLYLRGCLTCSLCYREKTFFWIGFLSMYAVIHTQFEYYAEHAFFVHQLQSLVLHHLGPFLIILGQAKQAFAAGCPTAVKHRMQGILVWLPVKALCHPFTATLLFVGLIGFWLLPSVHFIAMLDWRVHALMNISMVVNGQIFWGAVLNSDTKLSPGWRIAMMLVTVPPQILMGAFVFFTSHELYPIYTLCGRAYAGMNAIIDQQIGGLILWMHAAMMSVIGVLIVMHREFRHPLAAMRSSG